MRRRHALATFVGDVNWKRCFLAASLPSGPISAGKAPAVFVKSYKNTPTRSSQS